MSKQDLNQSDTFSQDQPLLLDELIKQQTVSPIHNLDEISRLWPADDDPNLLLEFLLNERVERRHLDIEKELIR